MGLKGSDIVPTKLCMGVSAWIIFVKDKCESWQGLVTLDIISSVRTWLVFLHSMHYKKSKATDRRFINLHHRDSRQNISWYLFSHSHTHTKHFSHTYFCGELTLRGSEAVTRGHFTVFGQQHHDLSYDWWHSSGLKWYVSMVKLYGSWHASICGWYTTLIGKHGSLQPIKFCVQIRIASSVICWLSNSGQSTAVHGYKSWVCQEQFQRLKRRIIRWSSSSSF